MKKMIIFVIVSWFFLALFPQQREDNFIRGIVYYLIGDRELARQYLGMHFKDNPQPDLQLGFSLLLKNQSWDSAKHFNNFLERNYRLRSMGALIGAALAMSDIESIAAEENLNKALRLNPNYVPALVCLGYQYLKKKNFPDAELALQKAVRYSPAAEVKIMFGQYYMEIGQVKKALDLARPEADALPQNFHFNLLSAQAALEMNQFDLVSQYTDRCLRIQPQSSEALLVQGKALVRKGEWKRARSIMEKLRFDNYNLDYSATMAEVLVRLQDSDAEKYLYEAFSQGKWHPRINRLFAVYFGNKKRGNVQNWINRALISGNSKEEMQKEVQGYQYPQYPFLAFFEVKKICWLGSTTLAVAGRMKSGESETIFLVNTSPFSISKSFSYQGSIQDLFPSPSGDKLMFSTTMAENEKINIYFLQLAAKKYVLRTITPQPIRLASIVGSFGEGESEFCFTDASFPSLAFESPFSVITSSRKRVLIYPQFLFPVYSYSFSSASVSLVKDIVKLRKIPLDDLKKYFMVADAFSTNQGVENLIRKGQSLDVTSAEYIRIHFSGDLSAIIINYANLSNAFQALIYHTNQNRAYRVDESMFLAKKKFTELFVLKFDPDKKEIYVLTKDKDRELISFNYSSLLYNRINSGVMDFFAPRQSNRFFVLTEKKKYMYYTDTTLEMISLSPYAREKLSARSDLTKILGSNSELDPVLFLSYNGEIVKLNEDKSFSAVHVSFDGAPNSISADKKQVALFVNGRLYLLKWLL